MRAPSRAALLAVAVLLLGCRDPVDPHAAAPSAGVEPRIVDLGQSLEPVRAQFNAHRGEKRFLTLLAPT